MQRQRGELVPIGEALSGMGGPVKAIRADCKARAALMLYFNTNMGATLVHALVPAYRRHGSSAEWPHRRLDLPDRP